MKMNDELKSKLDELTEDEQKMVTGGKKLETFAEGDWINTVFIQHSFDVPTLVAYQVIEVSGLVLTVQEYTTHPNLSGYHTGSTHRVPSFECWHVNKPYWI